MTIRCAWCKKLLWQSGDPVSYPGCDCNGPAKRKFYRGVRLGRMKDALTRLEGALSDMTRAAFGR